jgi:hypothetical protein
VSDPNGGIIFRTGATPSNRMIVTYGGNVGIGTTTPYDKLEVAGAIAATGNTAANASQGSATMIGFDSTVGFLTSVDWGSEFKPLDINAKSISFKIGTSSVSTKVYIDNTGNVGIGTTSPADGLHVANGAIRVSYFTSSFYGMGETGIGLVGT